jgi:PilZ domain
MQAARSTVLSRAAVSTPGFVPNVDGEPHRRPRETRARHRSPCRVRLVLDGQAAVLSGETVNRSANGLAMLLGVSLPVGTAVEILMAGPGEAGCVWGRVIHARQVTTGTYEIGVGLLAEADPD